MKKELSKNYKPFIDDNKLENLCEIHENASAIKDVIAKSMEKNPLSIEETAILLAAKSQDLKETIFNAARELKKNVYGNRIVLFAPLYIGNYCINDCKYCAFRRSLRTTVRKTLSEKELIEQIETLEDKGHKRLILVFGEHPDYTPEFIANSVKKVYSIKKGKGSIRRVNINAAPLDIEGYKIVKAAGIGTYQIFQETYHKKTYVEYHPAYTHKGDYDWRLDGLSRAYEGGCDDVGIGALFGLYKWKYEVLGLVAHARYLEKTYGCGPHTISFPRIRPAHGVTLKQEFIVSDEDFKHLVAVLRLSTPYTGMILTARETPEIRREVLEFGVSQIDAGTRIELAGYTKKEEKQELNKEQFSIGDMRPLDEVMLELLQNGYIPSFCTSCYRKGRTGQQFMEFAIPGFIQNLCTPNALLTLQEYLCDYASPKTREVGEKAIESELAKIANPEQREKIRKMLDGIKLQHNRDIYL
ncbi:MAG TPA: [FeFe] hydrogenase H-cluster radical SAM maturase HydG [Victivallales bacterium]|nr:[FeFe] hydrogenase H-cluster radical SAM maturase HydG [Victivallales bacterium]HRR27812.1 [FeFe] hydrogenase H-cluster radical SAM maturase HydG [Victivallales bacterium]HRU00078.1 [FeFe] hydrogenase H-cluster radical SAM maturase HydG [Victivallales bacterium]